MCIRDSLTIYERGYRSKRVDPEAWLAGADYPGQAAAPSKLWSPPEVPGTIFGIDISSWQTNYPLSKVKADGMQFVIIRLCDGTFVDPVFKSHLADAEKQGLLVSCYWYLRAPSEGSSIAQQVDVIDRQLDGRKDLGVWIDVESVGPGNTKLLTKDDVWSAKRELESRGYHVPGVYSGAWYWEHMPGGEPSMDGLGHLWVSNYGQNRRGDPRDTYLADGGDQHRGWSYPLGGRKPDLLQFGSEGVVGDKYPIDVNAYRGTRAQLARIFHPNNAKENTGGTTAVLTTKYFTDFIKGYLGPQIEALQEVWTQLRGPGGAGWAQLGQNDQGQNLTLVDAVAALRLDIAQLRRDLNLKEK